jgi:hypothetical protein
MKITLRTLSEEQRSQTKLINNCNDNLETSMARRTAVSTGGVLKGTLRMQTRSNEARRSLSIVAIGQVMKGVRRMPRR